MLEQGGLEGRELAVLSRVSGPHTWDSVQSKGDPACSFLPLELSLSSVQADQGGMWKGVTSTVTGAQE